MFFILFIKNIHVTVYKYTRVPRTISEKKISCIYFFNHSKVTLYNMILPRALHVCYYNII